MPTIRRVKVEVHMRIEFLPVPIIVGPATYVFRVIEQIGNARDPADQTQHIRRCEKFIKMPVRLAKWGKILMNSLAAHFTVLVERLAMVECRELANQPIQERRFDEILDKHMGKRIGLPKLLSEQRNTLLKIAGKNRGHSGLMVSCSRTTNVKRTLAVRVLTVGW